MALLAGPVLTTGAAASAVPAHTAIVVIEVAVPSPGPDEPQTVEELERLKLEEEIRQLRLENERAESPIGWLLDFAPFVTVLIGVITLAAALWKQSSDVAAARLESAKKDDQWQQEFARLKKLDAQEAEKARLGRFDESLTRISAQISSDNPGLSLNGAAALGLFARPLYADLHADLLRIIRANLKAGPDRPVADILRDQLERVLRLIFAEGREVPAAVPNPIDLARLDLYQLDLEGLVLPAGVTLDVAFADLKNANLSEATLRRTRGYQVSLDGARFSRSRMNESRFNGATAAGTPVNFHEAVLVSATFDDADLPRAEFQRASLQGAKFRRAVLRGARFEGASLSDAYFQDAVLDDPALRSIARGAVDWRAAHFTPEVRDLLEELSSGS